MTIFIKKKTKKQKKTFRIRKEKIINQIKKEKSRKIELEHLH